MPQPRYHFYRDELTRSYVLVDSQHPQVKPYESPPESAMLRLSDDQVLAILKGARHEEWLDRLVSSSFDKELIREHLKLVNKLVDQRVP